MFDPTKNPYAQLKAYGEYLAAINLQHIDETLMVGTPFKSTIIYDKNKISLGLKLADEKPEPIDLYSMVIDKEKNDRKRARIFQQSGSTIKNKK